MANTMNTPIPEPYTEALKKLRAASGDCACTAERLRDMTIFRNHLLIQAAASRWAAEQPATGRTYTQPPNSYDEALRRRDDRG